MSIEKSRPGSEEWQHEREEESKVQEERVKQELLDFETELPDDVVALKELRAELEDEWAKDEWAKTGDRSVLNFNMDKRNIINKKLCKMGVDFRED